MFRLCAVLVAATLAAAKEENAEMDIVNLTPMTFDEMVIDQTGDAEGMDWLIHFRTDWCERCDEVDETIAVAYENVNDDDLFVFADADCGWYPEMCAQFVSGSFPAIALITGTTRKVYKYEGDRESASELTDFIRRRGDGLGLLPTKEGLERTTPQDFVGRLGVMMDSYLLNVEGYIYEFGVTEDPLMNAVIIGGGLGLLLVLPLFLISFVFSLLATLPEQVAKPDSAAVVATPAKQIIEKKVVLKGSPLDDEDNEDITPMKTMSTPKRASIRLRAAATAKKFEISP